MGAVVRRTTGKRNTELKGHYAGGNGRVAGISRSPRIFRAASRLPQGAKLTLELDPPVVD
jgi:hypothetical protein